MNPFREATISLDAIADNVRHLRALTGTSVIGVVKANAYGHGAPAVAIAAFLIGIIPAIICDRRTKKNGKLTFTIVRLF